MGENLTEIDLSGSQVTAMHFELLLANVNKIRTLRFDRCPRLDGQSMSLIAKTCHSSLTELYVSDCSLFKVDPLLWMCGCIGLAASKLSKLKVLDLSSCPLEDKGLKAVAGCCQRLRFLNLSDCTLITDLAILELCEVSKHLEVLNLSCCRLISTKAVALIAQNSPKLMSLNISQLSKVDNRAIVALGKHCSKLQALNISGLRKVDEAAMLCLAEGCPGLLM